MWTKLALITALAILTLSSPAAGQANWNGQLTPGKTVGTLKYVGCANELSNGPRALTGASTANVTHMTVELCASYCAAQFFPLSGVEYGQECYCGAALRYGSMANQPAAGCNMACKGNNKQYCGGPNRISLFNNTAFVGSRNQGRIGSWSYQTCYMEPGQGRAVPDKVTSAEDMTVNKCLGICDGLSMPWAGLEYGRECWCAKSLTPDLEDASDPGCAMQCDLPCVGDRKQFCGGAGAINVYKKDGARKRHIHAGLIPRWNEEDSSAAAAFEKRHEDEDDDYDQDDDDETDGGDDDADQAAEEQHREELRETVPVLENRGIRFGRMRRDPAA